MLTLAANNAVTVYVYMEDVKQGEWGCMEKKETQDLFEVLRPKKNDGLLEYLVWIWISAGIWGALIVSVVVGVV